MGWQEDLAAGGRMPESHRDRYPEQYTHKLCGQWVNVINPAGELVARGEVERVTSTRWGELAHLKGGGETWWLASACHPADPEAAA